jgi:hypothetical protein
MEEQNINECFICKDELTPQLDPHFLPCGDSFCKQCILDFNETHNGKTQSACPCCAYNVEIPVDLSKLQSWNKSEYTLDCGHTVAYAFIYDSTTKFKNCSVCDTQVDVSAINKQLESGCVCVDGKHKKLKNCIAVVHSDIQDALDNMSELSTRFDENVAVKALELKETADNFFENAFSALNNQKRKFEEEYTFAINNLKTSSHNAQTAVKKQQHRFGNMKILEDKLRDNPDLKHILKGVVSDLYRDVKQTIVPDVNIRLKFGEFKPITYCITGCEEMSIQQRSNFVAEYKHIHNARSKVKLVYATCNKSGMFVLHENGEVSFCLWDTWKVGCKFKHIKNDSNIDSVVIVGKTGNNIIGSSNKLSIIVFNNFSFAHGGVFIDHEVNESDTHLLIKVAHGERLQYFIISNGATQLNVADMDYSLYATKGGGFMLGFDANAAGVNTKFCTVDLNSGNTTLVDKQPLPKNAHTINEAYVSLVNSQLHVYKDNRTYIAKGVAFLNYDYMRTAYEKYFIVIYNNEIIIFELTCMYT